MDVKEEIKQKILTLCKEHSSDDNNNLWFLHITNAVKYSKILAEKLGADVGICELSAWLHDISKLERNKENHHVTGAKRARVILESFLYEDKKIKIIESAILTHSSDENYLPKTIEQKILASADALALFEDFLLLVDKISSSFSKEETKKILLEKINISWKKACLLTEAEKLAKPRYEAIMFLLAD